MSEFVQTLDCTASTATKPFRTRSAFCRSAVLFAFCTSSRMMRFGSTSENRAMTAAILISLPVTFLVMLVWGPEVSIPSSESFRPSASLSFPSSTSIPTLALWVLLPDRSPGLLPAYLS